MDFHSVVLGDDYQYINLSAFQMCGDIIWMKGLGWRETWH